MANIVFCLPSFVGGGAERNTVELANEFNRIGHSVTLVVDEKSGPNHELISIGVVVVEIGKGKLRGVYELTCLLKRNSVDTVYANIGISPIKAFVACLLTGKSARLIVIYHSLFNKLAGRGTKATYFLAPLFGLFSRALVAVSDDVRSEILSKFRAASGKVITVGNPINIDNIREKAFSTNEACIDGNFLVTAGRFVPEKNYFVLLDAFARISNQIDHSLVIFGDGPLFLDVKKYAEQKGLGSRVLLMGYSNNPYAVIKNAALFVLASSAEGFGNVLVEAMALGVPVLATKCKGGPKDILGYGKYGRIAEVDDADSLAAEIMLALGDSHDPDKLIKRACDFDVKKIAREYLDVAGVN